MSASYAPEGKSCNSPETQFHGDNTGSNPVGDANKITDLAAKAPFLPFLGSNPVVKMD
jgi:hypothetical protein